MKNNKKPELLAPAGSMDALKAAVNNGCDAVYLGGKQFSARQYAGNFSLEELNEVCDYCHLRNVKVYVTVNTIYKEKELNEFINFIGELYKIGVDALIVQDIGAAKIVKENFPDFNLHASTQLTTSSIDDVKFLAENGFSKVVLNRELSLEDIKEITKEADIEIETFVHGALCVSYSGQCVMSSLIGGRSGNRGRCAQTCRLPYELVNEDDRIIEGHLICPKDIQTITILPELIEAGIDSFKIEGRMKSAEYVAGVTSIYRKYIDMYFDKSQDYKVDIKDSKILLQLFNRGGFTEGYYKTHSGSSMMSIERPKHWGLKVGHIDSYDAKHKRANIRTREPLVPGDGIEVWTANEPHVGSGISKNSKAGEIINISIDGNIEKNNVVYKTNDKALTDALNKTFEKDIRKSEIFAEAKVKKDECITLKLWDNNGNLIFVEGDVAQKAANQPMTKEKISQQLSKTGSTPFKIVNLDVIADDDVYVGVSALNDLRRRATESLEEAIIKRSKRKILKEIPEINADENKSVYNKKLNVLVSTDEQFDAVIKKGVNIVYVEIGQWFRDSVEYCIKKCHDNNIKIYAALPRIYRGYSKKLFDEFIDGLKKTNIDGFLVRSSGEFDRVKDSEKEIAIDYSFNVFNSQAIEFWENQGANIITLSTELNLKEIKSIANIKCETLFYGYIPLMVTHQCPIGSFDGGKVDKMFCKNKFNSEGYYLKDRKDVKFPLFTDCEQCVCNILNSKPLFTLKFFDEILDSPTGSGRLVFTIEDEKQTIEILDAYIEKMKSNKAPSPETARLIKNMGDNNSTKGHYFRGVE